MPLVPSKKVKHGGMLVEKWGKYLIPASGKRQIIGVYWPNRIITIMNLSGKMTEIMVPEHIQVRGGAYLDGGEARRKKK